MPWMTVRLESSNARLDASGLGAYGSAAFFVGDSDATAPLDPFDQRLHSVCADEMSRYAVPSNLDRSLNRSMASPSDAPRLTLLPVYGGKTGQGEL